ncbi:hypothetical protein I552_8817 [Mycobacterium xenopi 3993]|nr:hypothetical protein I552_8817 [Mycobacterium xenopi 3993]
MSVAESTPIRRRLTGTRFAPGSNPREEGKRCAYIRAEGG